MAPYHYAFCVTLPKEFDAEPIELVEACAESFRCFFAEQGIDRYIFQLEKGEKAGRYHFQGYCHYIKCQNEHGLTKRWQKGLDLKKVWIRPASSNGLEALKNYCMKDETRVCGPWSDKPIYMGQDLPKQLTEWQAKLEKYVQSDVNDREIIWIHDQVGCCGKSMFCKWLVYKHKAFLIQYAKAGDILFQAVKAGPKKIYIVDLTRAKPQEIGALDLYTAIESIKNGAVVSTKYEGGTMLMSPPHVIVMANHTPDVGALSVDRWNVVHLSDVHQIKQGLKRQTSFTL